MPAAVRFLDICSGHQCWPQRPNDQGSPNIFINNRPAHRRGDHWVVHCCVHPGCIHGCHDSVALKGSPNTFYNNLDAERVGDPVACGSTMITGSPNVFING